MSSGKVALTKFAGMVTAPGLLERNEASCIDALNWEFPAPGLIRKRRGFAKQTGNAGGPVWSLLTSRLMSTNVLVHIGTAAAGTSLRYGDGSVGLAGLSVVDGGPLTRTANAGSDASLRMHMAVCQRNHYCTADEGVARVESDIGTGLVRYAGMPRGQGPISGGRYLAGGTANPLADGYARAYRLTWHRKDADGVELGGAPTARVVVPNRAYIGGTYTGAARAAVLEFQVPWEFGTDATALTTSYFWRLWGTHTYAEATQLGNDEMFLVSEAFLTAGQITAGLVTYTDDTPDSFLLSSPRLHTNLYNFPPGEAGLLQGVANEDAPPPAANDVTYWQDVMWYADIEHRARLTAALITQFADGDTVTFTGPDGAPVVLTARAAPALATEFGIYVSGVSTAIDLRETVQFMLAKLNIQAKAGSCGIAGYLVGTSSTRPGLFYVEAYKTDAAGDSAFTTSVPAKFQLSDGYVPGAIMPTGAMPNGLAFSKPMRADAVPPVNRLTAGPADSRILRIMPFRDRLLVFTDYGIYQVTGRTFADFSVSPFDLGYRLMGRELVAECDEKIYAWCNEGIIEIDDGGVRVISAPIEPTIEAALVVAGSAAAYGYALRDGRLAFSAYGFAVGYRNQHLIRFHYPLYVNGVDAVGSACWLSFDTRTRAWARGEFTQREIANYRDARTCGVVRLADDLLAVGCWSSGADTYFFIERRAYAAADFTDDARNGNADAVLSRLRFQYAVPDESGAQHWQQTVINWDAEEISWRPLPTSILITHATEEGAATAQTVAVGEVVTRVETPRDARRGQRLYVELTHEAIQYAGIIGVSQSYRSGSRFARKVTP